MSDKQKWIPGPCIWCGQYVESRRDEAGAPNETANTDACWAALDGDFGCDESPETTDEGCGDHARPVDAARWLLAAMKEKP